MFQSYKVQKAPMNFRRCFFALTAENCDYITEYPPFICYNIISKEKQFHFIYIRGTHYET